MKKLNREDLERKAAARMELFRRGALKRDFWSYCLYTDFKFFNSRKEIMKPIADTLQKVTDAYSNGEIIRIALSMPPRAGKCVHPDTLVYTPNSPIKIKDINIGQEVLSFNEGKVCVERVVATSRNLKKQVKISYQTGEYIIVSPEHRLLTDRGYKEAKDITCDDFLIGYSSDVQLCEPKSIDDNELKFISYMIFDGHCGIGSSGFTKLNRQVLDDFISVCNALHIRTVESSKQGTNAKSIWLRRVEGDKIGIQNRIMDKYGILGHLSKTKRLPAQFFSMPNRQKWQFIDIMMQTDGWFDAKSGAITLSSEYLIDDIKYICNSLGLKTSITKKYNKEYDSFYWTLSFGRSQIKQMLDNCDLGINRKKAESIACGNVYSFLEVYPNWIKKDFHWTEQAKLNLDNKKNISKDKFERLLQINPLIEKYKMDDFYYMKIRDIEYIDEEIEMVDIQTTGVNNFIANGIVSHNSYIITLFCAFMLGHHPEESIMRNTCTATLYKKLSKDTREVVQSDKWQSLFNVKLKTKGVDTWSLEPARQSSYFGGGTGSTIIGFGASMLDISDDLYKNWEDAMSDDNNDKVLTWASAVRGSRVERGCCRIDIGTRWRTNDVIGVGDRDGLYDDVIRIPAMTEDGRSFCEAVQTTEHYLREKANVPEEVWSAEYMQQPIDIKGRAFSPDDMEWFNEGEVPDMDCAANIGVCDSADTGSDNLSFPMCKKIGNKYYIYDWVFTREPMTITEHLVRGKIVTNGLQNVRFESNNGGKLFAKSIADGAKGCSVTWKTTTQNKETRILNDSAWIKQNMVFRKQRMDKDGYPIQDDYSRAVQQLLAYIKGVKNQKDDAPDSLSMLRRFIEELGLNYVNRADDREAWESVPVSISNLRV